MRRVPHLGWAFGAAEAATEKASIARAKARAAISKWVNAVPVS